LLARALLLPAAVLASSLVAERWDDASSRATSRRLATITGTVYDSLLTGRPLAGAEVTIDGSSLTALTDRSGRFRIDAVPGGTAVLRFYHPSLDSLGFGARPVSVTVPDSGAVVVRLATPAAASLHAHFCPGAQPLSTGVLLGRVINVDDRTPLSGGSVSVRWNEWNLGARGLTRAERNASANTDAGDAFVVCGVPTDVAVVVRGTAADHVTGFVEVDLGKRVFGVRDLMVSARDTGASAGELARLDSAAQRGDSTGTTGTVRLTGSVHASDGRPLVGAQVGLLGFPVSVRTNSEAAFAFASIPAGSQTIEVRAVGFAPRRLTVALRTGENRRLDVVLDKAATSLATVNVVGAPVDKTGFEQRKKSGMGQYIGAEEIERRIVFDTSDLLRYISGARLVWDGFTNVIKFTRPYASGRGDGVQNNLCDPAVFLDGMQVLDINQVRPEDVRGIEVYKNKGTAPAEYQASSIKEVGGSVDTQCAVVLVWTRPRPVKPPRPK
jgi:hypothetical protein